MVLTAESSRLQKIGRNIVVLARTEMMPNVLGPRSRTGRPQGGRAGKTQTGGVGLRSFHTIVAASVICQALPTAARENVTPFHREEEADARPYVTPPAGGAGVPTLRGSVLPTARLPSVFTVMELLPRSTGPARRDQAVAWLPQQTKFYSFPWLGTPERYVGTGGGQVAPPRSPHSCGAPRGLPVRDGQTATSVEDDGEGSEPPSLAGGNVK